MRTQRRIRLSTDERVICERIYIYILSQRRVGVRSKENFVCVCVCMYIYKSVLYAGMRLEIADT